MVNLEFVLKLFDSRNHVQKSERRLDQDSEAGRHGTHHHLSTHQKYIYMWNNSHRKLETGVRIPIQPKLQKKISTKQGRMEKRHRVETCILRDIRKEE